MKVLDIDSKYDKDLSLCLGFFDCIHLGHESLIRAAKESGRECAVFTFSSDPSKILGGERQIYTFEERLNAVCGAGADVVVYAPFDKDFAKLSAKSFVSALARNFSVKSVYVGEDYTFGYMGEGDVEYLKEYFNEKGAEVNVLPFFVSEGEKLSTRKLKSFVKSGRVDELCGYLSEPYFMLGEVCHERHVGSALGYPTANVKIDPDRLPLFDGIYATVVEVDGKRYGAMTNVGAKPTFDVPTKTVESFLFDFEGDLYGKKIKISYIERLRDVTKFESKEALTAQLAIDETRAKQILNERKIV